MDEHALNLAHKAEDTELYSDSQSGISLFFNEDFLFRGGSIRKTVLYVNEINGHKIWGAVMVFARPAV
jgi:hypothetical protein